MLFSASQHMPPVSAPSPTTATTGRRSLAHVEGLAQPVGVGQRGGGVRVLDPVVLALGPARVAGQPAELAQAVEVVAAAGDDLVHVALVAGVEQDRLGRRVEDPVQGQRQLHRAEVRTEVAAGARHLADQEVPDLGGQQGELLGRQPSEIVWTGDLAQYGTHKTRDYWQRPTGCLIAAEATRRTAAAACSGRSAGPRCTRRGGSSGRRRSRSARSAASPRRARRAGRGPAPPDRRPRR